MRRARLDPEELEGLAFLEDDVNGESEEVDDRFLLVGRDLPQLPLPTLRVRDDGEGWRAIDLLGAEESFRCSFPLLQKIPEQHKGAWTKAFCEVLRRWREASCKEEADRALMWLGFLPQALQRKPVARGGKPGRAAVAMRYNCISEGDWGKVITVWQEDSERRREDWEQGVHATREEDGGKLKKEVLGLLRAGQLGRGMRRITSFGVADAHNPALLQQLREKFPPRQFKLPASVPKVAPVRSFSCLKEVLLSLEPGTSPGCGGCRPEYLKALGERMEQQEVELLEQFFLAYTAGELPPWFYSLWLSLQTVPLFKDNKKWMSDHSELGTASSGFFTRR